MNIEPENAGEIRIIVELNLDAQITTWCSLPVPIQRKKPTAARIVKNKKFELNVGPSLDDIFAATDRPHYTGLLSAKRLSEIVGRQFGPFGVTKIAENCVLVRVDHVERDLAFMVPIEKIRNPSQIVGHLVLPQAPALRHVEPCTCHLPTIG